jgi:hypothetical protein
MMEQLHKGGRTERVWSQYFVILSKGGRVDQDQVMMQDIKPTKLHTMYV